MNHAPRTGMSGEVGQVCAGIVHADGRVSQLFVRKPVHIECDFWLCTLREDADNDEPWSDRLELVP